MSMQVAKIALAVQGGLNTVCATCEHYWDAQDRKASTCGKSCGGLVTGRAFPSYKGPMQNMAAYCYVCGDTVVHVAKHPQRVFGVCDRHSEMVKEWCEIQGIPFEQVKTVFKKKGLIEAIEEVETYHAKKEGRL